MSSDTDSPVPSTAPVTQSETPSARVPEQSPRIDVIAYLSSPETAAQIADVNTWLDKLRVAAKTAGIDPRVVEVIRVIHQARKDIDAVRPLIDKLEKILPASAVVAIELSIEGIDTADELIKSVTF
jgi:hypothetical protein